MNQLDKVIKLKQWTSRYESKSGALNPVKTNVVPITGESLEHFLKKCEVAYNHKQSCGFILSEVKHKKTGRIPDVVCCNPNCGNEGEIEIVKTSLSPKAIGEIVRI